MFGKRKILRSGDPSWDGLRFELDDPRIPPSIRLQAQAYTRGDTSWYFCFANTDQGDEWWLFDAGGELVEAFWLEA